jgi:hypothetical protein
MAWVNGALAYRLLDRLDVPVVVVATRQRVPKCRWRSTRGDARRGGARRPARWPGKLRAPVDISGITYIDGDIGAPLPIAIALCTWGAAHHCRRRRAERIAGAPAAGAPEGLDARGGGAA